MSRLSHTLCDTKYDTWKAEDFKHCNWLHQHTSIPDPGAWPRASMHTIHSGLQARRTARRHSVSASEARLCRCRCYLRRYQCMHSLRWGIWEADHGEQIIYGGRAQLHEIVGNSTFVAHHTWDHTAAHHLDHDIRCPHSCPCPFHPHLSLPECLISRALVACTHSMSM